MRCRSRSRKLESGCPAAHAVRVRSAASRTHAATSANDRSHARAIGSNDASRISSKRNTPPMDSASQGVGQMRGIEDRRHDVVRRRQPRSTAVGVPQRPVLQVGVPVPCEDTKSQAFDERAYVFGAVSREHGDDQFEVRRVKLGDRIASGADHGQHDASLAFTNGHLQLHPGERGSPGKPLPHRRQRVSTRPPRRGVLDGFEQHRPWEVSAQELVERELRARRGILGDAQRARDRSPQGTLREQVREPARRPHVLDGFGSTLFEYLTEHRAIGVA